MAERAVAGSWLLALAVVCASCGGDKKESPPEPSSGATPAVTASPGEPSLTGEIAPPPAAPLSAPEKPKSASAQLGASTVECAIAGATYAGECKNMRDLRLVRQGKHAYIARPGEGVRRFLVAQGEGCHLTLDTSFGTGGLLAFPTDPPKPQALNRKGGVFLSSGGPTYKLVVSPNGDVVVYDFIRGIHRIAGPSGKASCRDLRGTVDALFAHGHLYTVDYTAVYRTTIAAKGCKRERLALPIEGMTINRIAAWGKRMVVGGSAKGRRGKVVKVIEGEKVVTQVGSDDSFADDGMCWVNGMAPCGDGLCVVDGNCRGFKRFRADGNLHAAIKLDKILEQGLYNVYGLERDAAGDVWMALSSRDPKTEVCTLRAYRLHF